MSVDSKKACRPGDVLCVSVYGGVLHEGIVTDTGTIISNSRRNGCVMEESVRDFAGLNRITNLGRLSTLDPYVAIYRARERLGRPYQPVRYNCQHFVRDCYQIRPKSAQRDIAVGALGVLALFAIF
ncbi:MAG: hypothetical protein HKO02_02125 [Hyphomonadaceae bacterium]|nr:hypothetical protein [Hyphomonadaceae bacterium]